MPGDIEAWGFGGLAREIQFGLGLFPSRNREGLNGKCADSEGDQQDAASR